MVTYMDPALRQYLAEQANSAPRTEMVTAMMRPKGTLEFPQGCGREALDLALALTSIG